MWNNSNNGNINTYDIFNGNDLKIAELIQQRRIQLLVHSYIYYNLDTNIISDKQWDEWARELFKLQKDNPDISMKVRYYDQFKDWDASTGAFFQFDDWVKQKAYKLCGKTKKSIIKKEKPKKLGKLF